MIYLLQSEYERNRDFLHQSVAQLKVRSTPIHTWCPFLFLFILYSLSRPLLVFMLYSSFIFYSFLLFTSFHLPYCFLSSPSPSSILFLSLSLFYPLPLPLSLSLSLPLPLPLPLLSTLRRPSLIDTAITELLLMTL